MDLEELKLKAKLAQKLRKACDAIDPIARTGRNKDQKYDYAKAEEYIAAVEIACKEAGLIVTCDIEETAREFYEKEKVYNDGGRKVTRWVWVKVACIATVTDIETGYSMPAKAVAEGLDAGDKATSKANTQARKLVLQNLFNLRATDDLEADERVDKEFSYGEGNSQNGNGSRPAQQPSRWRSQPRRQAEKPRHAKTGKPFATKAQLEKIQELSKNLNLSPETRQQIKDRYNVEKIGELDIAQGSELIKELCGVGNPSKEEEKPEPKEAAPAPEAEPEGLTKGQAKIWKYWTEKLKRGEKELTAFLFAMNLRGGLKKVTQPHVDDVLDRITFEAERRKKDTEPQSQEGQEELTEAAHG